tara:strand:- start:1288 stop:2499 length:1212 start_codon:yes stop_codon:yes gene_type:complete
MSNINDKAVFTVCNVAYLDKAMVLAESLFEHTQIKLDIFIFDKERKIYFNNDFCNFHWVENLEVPDFKFLSFKYTVIELTTALKPWLASKLLIENSKVIFLDPDVMVFNNLDDVFNDLDNHPVILTPHYHVPKINNLIDDEQLLRFGVYNLGFFAVNSSNDGKSFLNWWSERCLLNAYDDPQFGVFTDQKWVSLALNFFPFVFLSQNLGLNLAFWNIDEREIVMKNKKYVVNNKDDLIFLHFSAFDKTNPESLSKREFLYGKNKKSTISHLGLLYFERLIKFQDISDDTNYSFDYMSDGKYISPSLRRAYASTINILPKHSNPFDSKGVVQKFAKNNKLFEKSNEPYSAEGYSSIKKHSLKFKILYILMRLILRIMGPNNFMSFSRLLVYLSRYHKNPDIWKK